MTESELKYARGAGPRFAPGQRPLRPLELVTLAHVSILFLGITWAFGGQADYLRTPIAWWASLSVLIALTAVQDRDPWREGRMRPLQWLWPLVAFNVLVAAGTLVPNFREITNDGEIALVRRDTPLWLPSSARPNLALAALWIFDALYLSCFNLALIVRQRRSLRFVLLLMLANAFALAVFGTAQKLVQAKGLYFGTVPSPQKYFFSTFVYHNHWGAFILLMIAVGIGLAWHYGRRSTGRNFFHTPAFVGVVALLIMAATVPLSMSRSSTILGVVLVGGAFLHVLVRVIQKRRSYRESIAPPVLGAIIALVVAGAGIWYVASDSIMLRLDKTREQVAQMREMGSIGDRAVLYGNTWRMAKDKLFFGWGMASYPHVFTLYNTREAVDRLPVFYADAHSDWLQALAEHGIVGSLLLALCALVPLRRLRARHVGTSIPSYLLAGCILLLVYALIEFPFGNLAVVLTWWLCFFVAVHYARLQDREGNSGSESSAGRDGSG